jgi:predicted ATPase/DNA-binding winged helix-turn-helix (wHTH) protein
MSQREKLAREDTAPARVVGVFGPFTFWPEERRLEREQTIVKVGSRAMDLLIALVERSGDVVSRRELVERAWPGLVVGDGSLRFHIAGLRNVLGHGKDGARYIENVPGRGYCFVAPFSYVTPDPAHDTATLDDAPELPDFLRLPKPLVGRCVEVAELAEQLALHRFVSVIGTGGLGKTAVALAAAREFTRRSNAGVCFVDLAAIEDPGALVAACASALGVGRAHVDSESRLLHWLSDKRLLILLDNCEHVVESVSRLAETIHRSAPSVYLLATSREALRAEGEHVHALGPLALPRSGHLTAHEALLSPAVRLFMQRAEASGYRGELTNREAPIVAEICRRMDGVALAIELAASRVGVTGIAGTAECLRNRVCLSWQGRRSAPARQQTLRAMVSWSYCLLSENERHLLDRLAIFDGPFTPTAVRAVAVDTWPGGSIGEELLSSLVDKFLVLVSAGKSILEYRLTDVVRNFAMQNLRLRNEVGPVAQRLAHHIARMSVPNEVGGSRDSPESSGR